jgi:thiol-disulfide isomerase/thioredoxin
MKILLVIVVLVLAAVGAFIARNDPAEPAASQTVEPPVTALTTAEQPTATTAPPMLGQALTLSDLDGWLQADFAGLDELRGQVVIVQFWTFGCYNCKNTLPYLQDIYADYHDAGLEIVGVHSPEFDYEREPEAILSAARDLGVTWPIALDTNKHNFFAWQGSPAYWPRTYVLDQDGLIRFDHVGEGKYDELEQTVAALLGA